MKQIKLMNKIAKVGTDVFDKTAYAVGEDVNNPDAIMVRSAALHELEFNDELLAIARCGAGVNNIPIDRCSENGIVVFNTPGANANGVKELTLCALFLAARNIVGGIEWEKTLMGTEGVAKAVEKGKGGFAGGEVKGKTLGVIGLGAIGGMVANAATKLGMKVVGCDPFLSIKAAWNLDHHVVKADSYEEIYKVADYIALHVPATPQTKNMINAETIKTMKDGVKIINMARGDLVNSDDMIEALESGKVSAYVTDFADEKLLGKKGVVAIPHLGASTAEAEDNCAVMAAHQLDDYLKYGVIVNSVNYPVVEIPYCEGATRVIVFHKNVPAVISAISTLFADKGINIENLINKSKGDNAVTVVEVAGDVDDAVVNAVKEISDVVRTRKIKL